MNGDPQFSNEGKELPGELDDIEERDEAVKEAQKKSILDIAEAMSDGQRLLFVCLIVVGGIMVITGILKVISYFTG
jgi:phosphate uptake regulator